MRTPAEILFKYYPECTAQIEFKCIQAIKEYAKELLDAVRIKEVSEMRGDTGYFEYIDYGDGQVYTLNIDEIKKQIDKQ